MNPRDPSRPRAQAAFTLVELLVAIAILAIVTVLAWRGLDQVTRARDAIIEFLGEERATTQFFDQFHYDAEGVVTDSAVNDPPVQLAANELLLVRHLYPPGAAPRLQVVRYRLEGERLVRYASLPLATLGAVHAALGANPETDANWSSYTLAAPLAAARMRVWLPGSGWTDREDDVLAATQALRASPNLSASVATPATRTVTGFEVSLQGKNMRSPLTRIVLVGG